MNQIICGDALTELRKLPEELVQCFVTSPPYWGLRDYGTAKWEGGDSSCNHQRDSKCKNTSTGQKKVEGSIGDGIYKAVCKKCGAVRIDNQIGLEKTPEEYVSKMVEIFREVKRVLRKDGTLWLNMGDTYLGGGRGFEYWKDGGKQSTNKGSAVKCPKYGKPKDMCGIPWRVAFALQQDGWYLRSDIIWHKPNPMPESVTDRPTKSHEYIFLMTKSAKYYYDADAIREPHKRLWDASNGGNMADIGHKKSGKIETKNTHPNGYPLPNILGANKRSVWTVNTQPYSEAHFATFPEKLIVPCILAGCPEGGIVLDPFIGSGTTALVAQNLNRQYIGIELNPEYIKIINKRLQQQRAAI